MYERASATVAALMLLCTPASVFAQSAPMMSQVNPSFFEGMQYRQLAEEPPEPGDAVIVMGFPLGLRALMARTNPDFVEDLREARITDFWEVAERLSRAGHVTPLASRGIVGQVTTQNVVYDAETTSGGSGGPVLSLDGQVVAINVAILPEFGGSNLGVPAARASELLSVTIRPR